jgi:hypothetical protein
LLKKGKAPYIPYLGLHFKDLVFTNDGNPDRLGDKINIQKFMNLSNIVFQITRGLSRSYEIAVNEEMQNFFQSELSILSDDDLFWWSKR